MTDCCKHNTIAKSCIRKRDRKVFSLPRKFSRKQCKKVNGFTVRSSCAPYKGCKLGGKTQRRRRRYI